MTTVLVTPAGSGMAVTCLKALNRVESVRTVTTDIEELAPGLHLADAGYLVPSFDGPYLDAICDVVEQEGVDVVVPALDHVLELFATEKGRLSAAGATVVTASPETVRITNDKWQTVEALRETTVPLPDSWIRRSAAPEEFPLFIKPRRGSGSKQAYRVDSQRELNFYVSRIEDPIIQEYLPGSEVTVDCLQSDAHGTVCVPRERLETKGGISVKNRVFEDEQLREIGRRLTDVFDLSEAFFFQAKRDADGQFRLIEVNARIAGTMCPGFVTPSIQELAIREALDHDVERPTVHYGTRLTRHWAETYVTDEDCEFSAIRRTDEE